MAAFFTKKTEEVIRSNAKGGRPWCAVLSFYGPHHPVTPPQPWDDMYPMEQVELPANHHDDFSKKPWQQKKSKRYKFDKWTGEQFKDYIRRYWGYCSYIDDQIGKVFKTLRQTGQWENTIIVFTSDHGDMVASHGFIYKMGANAYDELYHVPTIIYIPGLTRAGSRCKALVSQIDLLPSLLEAAKLPMPNNIDGRSLVELLKGKTENHRDIIFAESQSNTLMCRDKKYKFVANWHSRQLEELYNLSTDPGETENLAFEPEYADTAKKMREQIINWAKQTGHMYAEVIEKKLIENSKLRPGEKITAGTKRIS
jgi:arylsulfatase A-like enzyme